ncbi:MAG: hypothetical protein KDN20_15920, partial [Verrucomicrobiae bacterium]|nr:hypothetical protein [Verrucomicrobiae bacterium]
MALVASLFAGVVAFGGQEDSAAGQTKVPLVEGYDIPLIETGPVGGGGSLAPRRSLSVEGLVGKIREAERKERPKEKGASERGEGLAEPQGMRGKRAVSSVVSLDPAPSGGGVEAYDVPVVFEEVQDAGGAQDQRVQFKLNAFADHESRVPVAAPETNA